MNRKKTGHETLWTTAIACILTFVLAGPTLAAEVLSVGTATRNGSITDGFPEFLKVGNTNATTRAWNLGGDPTATDVTLNGISLDGPDGGGYDNGLTVSGGVTFSESTFVFVGDPQQTAKDNISNTGEFDETLWSVDITATPGATYTVELLSVAATAVATRTLDVTVDGVLFADNLFVPLTAASAFYTVVYRFDVVADADGIDIAFSTGADEAKEPYVNALAVTQQVPAPAALPAGLALLGLAAMRRRRQF